MGELIEFHEMAYKLTGKVYRRTRKIKQHMMTCETCLNRQVKLGLLLTVEEFYEQAQQDHLSKLRYMVN